MNHEIDDYHEAVVRLQQRCSDDAAAAIAAGEPRCMELVIAFRRDLALLRSWYGVEDPLDRNAATQ